MSCESIIHLVVFGVLMHIAFIIIWIKSKDSYRELIIRIYFVAIILILFVIILTKAIEFITKLICE